MTTATAQSTTATRAEAPRTTGLLGVCSAGTMTCLNGSVSCKQNQQAGTGLCTNSLDDDCDGTVNEGCSITAQIIHYELEQSTGATVPNLAVGQPAARPTAATCG
jgi:hypothetical protein